MFRKLIRICAVIWAILIALTAASEIVKYSSGGYVKVDAIVTWVNHFEGWSRSGGYYDRANGYVEWEYKGLSFVSDERSDLPAEAKEGDTKSIWIDAKTGEYTVVQGLWYSLIGSALHILFCVLILKFVKVEKGKKGKQAEKEITTIPDCE